MKRGDIVEVVDVASDFPEEDGTNWIKEEEKPIRVGDRFEVSLEKTNFIGLKGRIFYHPKKRFKVVSGI